MLAPAREIVSPSLKRMEALMEISPSSIGKETVATPFSRAIVAPESRLAKSSAPPPVSSATATGVGVENKGIKRLIIAVISSIEPYAFKSPIFTYAVPDS